MLMGFGYLIITIKIGFLLLWVGFIFINCVIECSGFRNYAGFQPATKSPYYKIFKPLNKKSQWLDWDF